MTSFLNSLTLANPLLVFIIAVQVPSCIYAQVEMQDDDRDLEVFQRGKG